MKVLFLVAVCCGWATSGATVPPASAPFRVGDHTDLHEDTPEARLIRHLDEKGFPFTESNVSVSRFPERGEGGGGRRGLRARVNVSRGDTVLSVPRTFFMSRASARASAIGDVVRALEGTFSDKWLLTLHLMYEYFDPASKWRPYLDTLPKPSADDTHALLWSERDFAELQCSPEVECPVISRVKEEQADAKMVFDELAPLMAPFYSSSPLQAFTWEGFVWAYSTVKARCFTINVTDTYGTRFRDADPSLPKGLMSLLVPIGDLFNHHNSVPALQFAYEFNDKTDSLVVYADQDYAAGDEVFISYGILTNPDLLLSYGFVMQDNAYETVGFRLGMDLSGRWDEAVGGGGNGAPQRSSSMTPLDALKGDLLRDRGLNNALETHIGVDGRPSAKFMEALRIREVTLEDLVPRLARAKRQKEDAAAGAAAAAAASGGVRKGQDQPWARLDVPPPPPGFPGSEPPLDPPPLPGGSGSFGTAGAVHPPGAERLDDQLKKAVADALSGLFPGEAGSEGGEAVENDGSSKDAMFGQDTPEIAEARASAAQVDFSLPFSGDNELSAYGILLQGAESLLKRYPTSLEQDMKLLGKVPMNAPIDTDGTANDKDNEEDGSGWVMAAERHGLGPLHEISPRQRVAVSMRVETKRILHAVVLECLLGMRQSYALIAAERALRVSAEPPVPEGDTRAQAMEQRRANVHEKMRMHFDKGSKEWEGKWLVWRRRVARVWGKSVREVGNFLEGRSSQSVSSAERVLSENVKRTEEIVRDLIQKGLLDNALKNMVGGASGAGGAGQHVDEREMLGGAVNIDALRGAEQERMEDLRKLNEHEGDGDSIETIEL